MRAEGTRREVIRRDIFRSVFLRFSFFAKFSERILSYLNRRSR